MDKNIIIIIRLKSGASRLDDFRRRLLESKDGKPACYIVTNESDNETINNLCNQGEHLNCSFLDYQENEISRIYWTNAELIKSKHGYSISCRLIYDTEASSIISNFESCLDLDLKSDFANKSYIVCESSSSLVKQMKLLEIYGRKLFIIDRTYNEIIDEAQLCPLAQKNEYCTRQYNLMQPDELRGEYLRDYDRILYSKAFRRMVDKAQIFSSTKGDHFRTRMTHTLLVCQIARSICCALNLNRSLTEAIAIGHDLGHTPFGHAGERALHNILTGQKGFEITDLSINMGYPYGGFKHNYQGVRVATILENAYPEVSGMDLSYQTLDGILYHTKARPDVDIEEFTKCKMISGSDQPKTLEGQIVFIADEIAVFAKFELQQMSTKSVAAQRS
jgi:dGTPase